MAAQNPFVNEFGDFSNDILLNIAEILSMRLPDGAERIIAAKWVKKFLECNPKDYRHYLSLFVNSLTKQLLVDPFDKLPSDMTEKWHEFEKEYTFEDINTKIIQRLYRETHTPQYQLDISENMKELVAFQEIPFFGAHFYYAFSPRDTIDKWTNFNKMNFPKAMIQELQEDEPEELPVNVRLHPRYEQHRVFNTKGKLSLKMQKTIHKTPAKPRPEWQGPVPEEIEPEPEKPKPMISIPTGGSIKNIPPALQRRMIQAEQERQERLARKEKDRLAKSQRMFETPKKSFRIPASKTTVRKRLLKTPLAQRTDSVDAELLRASKVANEKESCSSTFQKAPEFSGPFAHIQQRLHLLRESNQIPPLDLVQTARDMNAASAQINAEADRLTRGGTANLSKLNSIHKQEETIGYRILKMLREHQARDIQEVAENASDALNHTRMTMEQLNEMLNKTRPARDDTIQRLEEIKRNMEGAIVMTQNVCDVAMGERLLEAVNGIVNVNDNTVRRLQRIQRQNPVEGVLIEGLERNNAELADAVKEKADQLANALDNRSQNLPAIMHSVALSVDELLSLSFSMDAALNENAPETSAAVKAILIEDERNIMLEKINAEAVEIADRVENIYKNAASSLLVSRFLTTDDIDRSDDIIDIENVDLGFADTLEESVMKSRRENVFAKIPDSEENLFNISNSLINDLEKSIEFIEKELITDLTNKQSESNDTQEQRIINDVIKVAKENVAILEMQLSNILTVKNSLDEDDDGINSQNAHTTEDFPEEMYDLFK